MKKTRNIILNILIVILLIALIAVMSLYIKRKNDVNTTGLSKSEQEYRNEVRANIIEEYITKPQEKTEHMWNEFVKDYY